jgi:leucyl aminopeptidase
MLACFADKNTSAIPVSLLTAADFPAWLSAQNDTVKNWLASSQYRAEAGNISYIPDASGKIQRVVHCVSNLKNFWAVGSLSTMLPEGIYSFEGVDEHYANLALAWGLGAYQFSRYKKFNKVPAKLVLPASPENKLTENLVAAIYLVRDLINTPTDDMGPTELWESFSALGKQYNAQVSQIVGEDLLTENYASIYTVGRASDDAPRLLDMRWGKSTDPKVTLVGKGVCFDSGGLDLKPSSGMLLMKKDMAGAANVMGLARMIMEAGLPVCLRVLVPAVENVIAGNAYRPGDIIKSRKGLTIEIGNTDAEGRVVLADALAEAVTENPAILIDMATLTGAARVAVGTDIAAMFSNNDALAADITQHAEQQLDPVWRLPLYAPYRDSLNSTIADINNNSSDGYAGAITAGLFLKEFVPDNIPWLHFDMMAWNLKSKPGHPVGGEAMAIRALFSYLANKYSK